ncbi:MAG: 6,7-dimethyl-8-ribityllumazine synthase [Sporichthyaceae bacterium]
MSGQGAPELATPEAGDLRVAIVAAQWHAQVMAGLLAGAKRALAEARIEDPTIVRVPGTFEVPVAARRLAARHDVVVALGVVVRGGTPHFEYVCEAATMGLTQVGVETGVPIGFGVLTCDNDAQAHERAGLPGSKEDKGYEATQAAIRTAVALRDAGV